MGILGNQSSVNQILGNQTPKNQISVNQTSINQTSVNDILGNLPTSVNPISPPNNCSTSLIDSAVDVLPTDIDLTTFLLSPQLQMAWYTHLSRTSERNTTFFKEVVISLKQNHELLQEIKEKLKSRKKV